MSVSSSCLCGAVRFICEAGVGPAGYCHCADCRKCTGSAFNISVPCPTAAFRILQGELGSFTKTGASGSAKAHPRPVKGLNEENPRPLCGRGWRTPVSRVRVEAQDEELAARSARSPSPASLRSAPSPAERARV